MFRKFFSIFILSSILIQSCAAPQSNNLPQNTQPATAVSTPGNYNPDGITPALEQTQNPDESLTVKILFPGPESIFEMGQEVKAIVEVSTSLGDLLPNAELSMSVVQPGGSSFPVALSPGAGDVFRSEAWSIPHRSASGKWEITVNARLGQILGKASSIFQVVPSTSEVLLDKYGFWLDAPSLRGIISSIYEERGDAHNGMLRWGGFLGAQHILPANFIDLAWREGKFPLANEEDVRRYLLDEIGIIGFFPVREIRSAVPYRFKNWDGWKVEMLAELKLDKMEWVVFYAPEVDKTYSLGTTVVQAPSGIDPHQALRQSFEVHPELNPSGIAPLPLLDLLPGPIQLTPVLGERFIGTTKPVTLSWQPVKELEENEYYEVSITYDYGENRTTLNYQTRETQFNMPVDLYKAPNCMVFNWEVTLKRQTGTDILGRPVGDALTFPSLYWYITWLYPQGEEKQWFYSCPNPLT